MTVKEIKLQALRLMFADSDVQFSTTEYDNGTLTSNANTREKLVRMDDSIRRAIDLYNTLVEQETLINETLLLSVSSNVYANTIDTSTYVTGDYPTRVDVFLYQTVDGVTELVYTKDQVSYVYDAINKKIYFQDVDYAKYYNEYDIYSLKFRIWFKVKKQNLAFGNQDTTNLDTLRIPSDVQNMIPVYIKGELYEEDDFVVAQTSKQEFARFLQTVRQPFNKVQTKVKRARVFDK
ncbi:MAG: hypothetical protein ACO3BB_00130 [Bacilli bacterium]